MKFISRLFKDESGTTAVEYALIAALISVAIVVAVTNVGNQLIAVFNRIVGSLTLPA